MRIIRTLFLTILLATLGLPLWAQTLNDARKLYDNGDYAQALPIFERLIKSAPNNANYNLWYGVCLMNTDSTAQARKYLETAVQRKATGSTVQLAEAYRRLYLFENATDLLETYISDQQKRRRPTEEASVLLEQCQKGLRMIKGVEQTVFIDSVVVDKASFLSHYKLSDPSGRLTFGNGQLQTEAGDQSVLFTTEMEDMRLLSLLGTDSIYRLYASRKEASGWSTPTLLPDDINTGDNVSYPFLMPDGVTMYFASDGDDSLGGYDIYVTRYNPDDGSYYMPDNIGMPFNSTANDYMYAVDEYNGIGWFATDRNQPDGKVCIYLFLPSEDRRFYNYEGMSAEDIASRAQILAIRDTWTDNAQVQSALTRVQEVSAQQTGDPSAKDFEFVVGNGQIYHRLSDFRNQQARNAFVQYQNATHAYESLVTNLQARRRQYAQASDGQKDSLRDQIIDLEQQEQAMYQSLHSQAQEIRNLEK